MKAKMKGVIGAVKPMIQNQAAMWSEPDLVGWLEKRGGKFKSWKKRFFVLQGSYLFYFENDFKVQSKNPLGVIPIDGSKVEIKNEEAGDASRRYTIFICLSWEYVGYSKRDTYVIAAPSHQALLRKARWRGGDLRRMLENSLGNKEILEFAGSEHEGQGIMTELIKVREETEKIQGEVMGVESRANQEEGALMRAIVAWDILNQYLTGKAQAGEPSSAEIRIKTETGTVQQLYRMLQTKGNFLQGQNIEYLGKDARGKLQLKLDQALYLVQEQQAKVRSKAPRYSFNFNPKIFEDEGEYLQQEFEPETEATQPAALKIYKNIRAEVLETAEQLKNLKNTALKVAGIEQKGEENIDKLISLQAGEGSMDNRVISNSNMLMNMMKQKAASAAELSVEDTSGHHRAEGTTKAWIKSQNQQGGFGFQSQSTPPPLTSWQETQQASERPTSQAFAAQPQSFAPPGIPRPTSISQTRGRFPMNQRPAVRPVNQPSQPVEPSPQAFSPRGFQQQMGSMPSQPVGPSPQTFSPGGLQQKMGSMPLPSIGPSSQTFSPRGFQQQMGSMPLSSVGPSPQTFSPRGFQQQMGSRPLASVGPSPQTFSPRGFQQQMGSMPLPPAPATAMLRPTQPMAATEASLQDMGPYRPMMAGTRQQAPTTAPGRLLPTSFTPPRMSNNPAFAAMPGAGMIQTPQSFPPRGVPSGWQPQAMPVSTTRPLPSSQMYPAAIAQGARPVPLQAARPVPLQMSQAQQNFRGHPF